jgi:uncharacterized protein YhaN
VKILNLDLTAYGPFTGKRLNFAEGGANLHIVYGANEAGKSCTLRALSNALYGIPQDTKDAFLHLYDDLRIGLTLNSDKDAIQVVRRKGRANSLRRNDASESVFPPAEWSALLPVADRDLFDRMFGVDHAEIAKGGELLLSSRSDLGGLLFAAAGGVDRLRAVQADFQKSAEELFTKRAQKTQINKAVAELKVAAAAVKQSMMLVSGYKQLRDSLEEAESRSRKLEKAIGEASLEEQRLRRLQQAFPLVAKRQQRIEQLKRHEGSRTLPAEFADRYRSAHDELRRSESETASQSRDIEGLQAKIDATPVALGILERESEIDLLYQQSGAVKKGADDRVRRQQTLETARAEAAALLDSIGVRMALEDAAKLRIPDPAQKRIFTLSTSKKAVDQGVEAATRDLEKAREEQRKANQELSELAVAVDTGALEEALAMAPPGRDLEAENSRLSNEAAAAKTELERSVSALPDWNGTLEQLAAAPAPLPETIAEFQNSFLEQSAEERRLLADRARLKADRDRVERDLRKIAQEQEVPTEQDLATTRTSRDAQWQTIRTAWLEAIAVDAPGLASSFETSVLTSDQIADRLRRETARVSEKAALLVSLERLEEQSATLELQIEAGQRGAAELQKKWESRWSATAVLPRTPLEMQSWLRQRELILANASELRKRQAEIAGLQDSILAVRRALISELGAIGGGAIDAGTPLAALATQAKRAVSRQAELRQRKATLQADVQRFVGAIADLEHRQKSANGALSMWRDEWSEATEKLPVRRDASPEEVQVVLERITSLMAKIDEIGKLEDRIAKLTKDEAEFTLRVTSLVESARLGIPVENPFAAIVKFNADLQQNRTNRDLLKTFVKQSEDKQKLLARSRDKAVACDALLVELCKEAGAADPDCLPECIGTAAEKRKLSGELSELEDSLSNFAGSETIAQLVVDLEALNVDELPNRIAQLQQQAEAFRKEKADSDQSLGASRLELKQKEGADSAGQAAEDVEHLRSRIGNLTEEYVRLRLASRILANAVERYREKNQGPLLKTAARLFHQLTDGSFEDLRVDWNDQGEAGLMGIRGTSQKQVGVEGMSEATRDQLFLALRLAYVMNYCDSHGPVPFIADDVLMTFDDARATAALRALETLSKHTQVLLFTHHRHHLELASSGLSSAAYRVHNLG